MKGWFYNGQLIQSIEDLPKECHGFVYRITHKPTGSMYVGKKNIYSVRRKTKTKKQLLLEKETKAQGYRSKKTTVVAESDWLTYTGSNKDFTNIIKGCKQDDLYKEILCLCKDAKTLTFNELKYQILLGVLEKKEYINSNILGKFFTKDTQVI